MTTRGPLPDARELLLLKAALLEGDAACAAWRAWRAQADLDRIEQGSFRLLPLVFRNLEGLGVEDPWKGLLQGFYRRAWCENQLLFRRLASVLTRLHGDGIDVLVLKGAALIDRAYRDAGVRPMADADVLVRRRDFVRTVACLRRTGWTTEEPAGSRFDASPAAFRASYHAIGFRGDGDRLAMLDVHDRPFQVYARHPVDIAEERLWRDAEPFELAGVSARRLSAEHALLHACFHGYQRQDVAPIRWVADVDRLVRANERSLRWDRLLDDARRWRVVSALRDALPFVAREFATPVPPAVLRRLQRMPLALTDRLERAMRVGGPKWLADYGKTLAPASRWLRERGAARRLPVGATIEAGYRLFVKLPKRHVSRVVAGWFRRKGAGVPHTPVSQIS